MEPCEDEKAETDEQQGDYRELRERSRAQLGPVLPQTLPVPLDDVFVAPIARCGFVSVEDL